MQWKRRHVRTWFGVSFWIEFVIDLFIIIDIFIITDLFIITKLVSTITFIHLFFAFICHKVHEGDYIDNYIMSP